MADQVPEFLTASEVAGLFQVSIRQVQRWTSDGSLSCHRLGTRLIRYTKDDVCRFMKDHYDPGKSHGAA